MGDQYKTVAELDAIGEQYDDYPKDGDKSEKVEYLEAQGEDVLKAKDDSAEVAAANGCPHGAPSRGACDRCTAEDEAAAEAAR